MRVDRRRWRMAVRYLSGEATAEEREKMQRWVDESPEHAAELESLRTLSDAVAEAPEHNVDVEAVWQRVAARTVLADENVAWPGRAGAPTALRSANWSSVLLRIAAVLALVAA